MYKITESSFTVLNNTFLFCVAVYRLTVQISYFLPFRIIEMEVTVSCYIKTSLCLLVILEILGCTVKPVFRDHSGDNPKGGLC